MKTHLFIVAIVITACFATPVARRAEQGGTEKKAGLPHRPRPLFLPLDLVKNCPSRWRMSPVTFSTSKKPGYFALTDVRYDRTEDYREEA